MSNSNISKKLAQVNPGTLHVGVDLALEGNTGIIIDENARQYSRFYFPQNTDGYDYFQNHIEKVRQKQDATQVLVAMEPTNYFWKLLANRLEEKQIPYHLVNAYTVKKHREGDQIDRSKDDPRDSFTIADLSRTGKYTETRMQRGIYAELRQYATLYYQLTRDVRREKNILWGLLGQVFPELRQVFKALTSQTFKAMMKTCPAAVSVRAFNEDDFIARVRTSFSGKRLFITKLHQAYRLAKTSIGLVDGIQANYLAIQIHLEHLEFLQRDISRVIVDLKTCLQQVEVSKYLLSVKGLSTLSVALFFAEIGDPSHYSSGKQLVKLGGIQPTPNRSGHKQNSPTPMSHQGRPGLRSVLYLACLRLIQVDRRFKDIYHYLQTRIQNPLTKMQALGVLMNKLLHILWALMRKKTFYIPDFAGSA